MLLLLLLINAGVPMELTGWLVTVGSSFQACQVREEVSEISNMFDISTTVFNPCNRP